MNDEQIINKLGTESALDLAVEREKLTRSIEKETIATKISTETEQGLTQRRAMLLEELNKQGSLIDYSQDLNEQHKAVLESLKRKIDSNNGVATANQKQADDIAKQTGAIRKNGDQTSNTFKKVSKQTTLMGSIASKALKGVSSFIGAQVDSVLADIPLGPELQSAAKFTKSVFPKHKPDKEKKEKRIQSLAAKAREYKAAAVLQPQSQPKQDSDFQEALKKLQIRGEDRNARIMLNHISNIDKTTQAILKEVKDSMLVDFIGKIMVMAAVMSLGKLLFKIPAMIAGALAKKLLDGMSGGAKPPKPDPKKPNPTTADPKNTDPNKADPKKAEPVKTDPKADPTKTNPKQTDPSKPQPKPEPAAKTDIPKTDPKPRTSQPKPSSGPTAPTEAGKVNKAGKVAEGLGKVGKGATKLMKGIPFLGSILFGADVVQKQMADDRNVGLGHARAIMNGDQDNYKGDYKTPKPEPVKIERGEQSLAAEGMKLSEEEAKKAQEEKKEALKTQALMAQSVSSRSNLNQTTVNNISGGSNSGSSEIRPFGNEYQTPYQKGTMIHR